MTLEEVTVTATNFGVISVLYMSQCAFYHHWGKVRQELKRGTGSNHGENMLSSLALFHAQLAFL